MIKFKVIFNDNSEKVFEAKDNQSHTVKKMIKHNSCEGIMCEECPILLNRNDPNCHFLLKSSKVKSIKLIPFSPEIKQVPKTTNQDFKTQADIFKALLDGKTIVSYNREAKLIDGYLHVSVNGSDFNRKEVTFYTPNLWHIKTRIVAVERWVNIYPSGMFDHNSKQNADKSKTNSRIACVCLTGQYSTSE